VHVAPVVEEERDRRRDPLRALALTCVDALS
jgi:hypothetical protein